MNAGCGSMLVADSKLAVNLFWSIGILFQLIPPFGATLTRIIKPPSGLPLPNARTPQLNRSDNSGFAAFCDAVEAAAQKVRIATIKNCIGRPRIALSPIHLMHI